MQDLGLMWPILAAHGTGQQISVYNSLITAPKNRETDGPEKMIVILLDNKRSELYGNDDQYEVLKCIRCGACLNAVRYTETLAVILTMQLTADQLVR